MHSDTEHGGQHILQRGKLWPPLCVSFFLTAALCYVEAALIILTFFKVLQSPGPGLVHTVPSIRACKSQRLSYCATHLWPAICILRSLIMDDTASCKSWVMTAFKRWLSWSAEDATFVEHSNFIFIINNLSFLQILILSNEEINENKFVGFLVLAAWVVCWCEMSIDHDLSKSWAHNWGPSPCLIFIF